MIQPRLRRRFRFRLTRRDHGAFGVRLKRAVEMKPRDQVLARLRADFGQQEFDQKRRAENLFEVRFELRAQAKADQPAQADIFRRAIEGLQVRRVDGCLADFFDVCRVPQPGERVAVEQFKHLRMAGAHSEQKDSVAQRRGEDGRAAFKLFPHVFAAVSNRFQPTIGFLGHALSNSACFSAAMVSTPAPRSTLIVAKVCASGFTPPVAESNSEAIINRRSANCTAC